MLNKGALESSECQLAKQRIFKSETRRLHDAFYAFLRLPCEFPSENNWPGSRLGDTTLCISDETCLNADTHLSELQSLSENAPQLSHSPGTPF